MSESTTTALEDTAVGNTLAILAEEPVTLATASNDQKEKIEELKRQLNMSDSNDILFFGSQAQEQLTTISDNMLEGVKNKELGTAGESLNEMVGVLRGFNVAGLDPTEKPGLLARLIAWITGRTAPVAQFIQQYEEVRPQIDAVTDRLESHKTTLLRDIVSLDKLYEANLAYFHDLELFIAAGESKLDECDTVLIPELVVKAESATDDMLKAQELRDLRARRDDLERRVHDLRLTRQVAMQALPSIRMVQENDKGLITKINTTLVNTVPLWRNQLAQAVSIYRSQKVATDVKAATDLTNELLEKNSENLREANRQVRTEMERGVFDMDSVRKAHANLLASIEESLVIADEGKRRRAKAETELHRLEGELRESLLAAKSHGTTPTTEATDKDA